MPTAKFELKEDYAVGSFTAMACPCEILIESQDTQLISNLTQLAYQEAKRIEKKFSRYLQGNIIYKINHSRANPIDVDTETALLLDFAQQCFDLSEGKFDITSGILRRVWRFDQGDKIPTKQQISAIACNIGWQKVSWKPPTLCLPSNMEIDLGGIGKEYAVDSTVRLLKQYTDCSFLVNFGGDIACPHARKNNQPWMVGVDNPQDTSYKPAGNIALYQGGLATSGDSQRYLLKDGVRYSHILNPKTGYPVEHAPHSVSVIADTCIEAGMLSTFAILEGANAAEFLESQGVKFWCI